MFWGRKAKQTRERNRERKFEICLKDQKGKNNNSRNDKKR